MIEGSPAAYEAIRTWEVELMIELQMTEEQYGQLPLMERSRKVAGNNLKDWVKSLETYRQYKEMKAKHG